MRTSPTKILITAGPTREMLDPVRFLSNLSTGEMGYAIAREACRRGYRVTLISGPVAIKPPKGIKFIPVVSVQDMKTACERYFLRHDILVMTAAVCDFTIAHFRQHKIQRRRTHKLLLKQTPDIVAGLAKSKGHRKVVGFCLETEDWIRQAKNKLKRKHLDGIVANFYHPGHVPFGRRSIKTAFIDWTGVIRYLRRQPKRRIAVEFLDWVEALPPRGAPGKEELAGGPSSSWSRDKGE